MKPFDYALPPDPKSAAALLRERPGKARPIAGGTDLIPRMKAGLTAPERLVNLKSIPGLDRIEPRPDGMHLGALVTLARLAADPALRRDFTALAEAAGDAATPQVRNAGTLGGNLCQRPRCWYFRHPDFRCRKKGGEECFALEGENKYHAIFGGPECRIVHPSNTAPALMALDSRVVVLSGRKSREIPTEKFFALPAVDVSRENVLEEGELVTGVRIPRPPEATRSRYGEIRERATFDFALVSCAVALTFDGGRCVRARVVLGSVAPVPWRCPGAEAILTGARLDETVAGRAAAAALEGADPLSGNRYKVSLARTLLRRTLTSLAPA
jgi:xanthine dehydrogenase YagS FAD-binding subunit